MSKLSGIKISHKISSLMMGLVVGFVIMAVAYYAQITADKSISSATATYTTVDRLITSTLKSTVEMRSAMPEYVETGSEESLANFRGARMQINETLHLLESTDRKFFNAEALKAASDANNQLNSLFSAVTESQKETTSNLDAKEKQEQKEKTEQKEKIEQKEKQKSELNSAALTLSTELHAYRELIDHRVQRVVEKSRTDLSIARNIFSVALLVTAIGTTVGLFLIYRSIVLPLWHMQAIIAQQNKGNDKARVRIQANDELGDLGRAFNRLLDERIKGLAEQSQENEALNTSIISLIRALGTIARKDLTIKVPVSADVTGTISDAVNLLTSETAVTLQEVKNISDRVNAIANQLQAQSAVVMGVAEEERSQVQETVSALDQSARTMTEIAKEARTANTIAASAIDYTQKAQQSVFETVNGIQTIRGTISETEKRIKRLGDRSQEITGIVNLINTIAERTHILALNASMHAASAGEAGKGFAVVAEEVQRLAENARGATSEISAMVNNIRVETSDTVNVMNKLITQVAEGTKLAEESGQRMHDTEAATRQLVNHVKSIAVSSMNQVSVATRVRDRANLISESTEKTAHQLVEQRAQTDDLKIAAHDLVERVSVFKLPESTTEKAKVANLAAVASTPIVSNSVPTPNQAHLEQVAMGQSSVVPTQAKLA